MVWTGIYGVWNENHLITHIFVALPSITHNEKLQILRKTDEYQIILRFLPNINKFFDGTTKFEEINKINLEDLVSRKNLIDFNLDYQKYYEGKSILITGAGGSIGSELCRFFINLFLVRLLDSFIACAPLLWCSFSQEG